MLTALVAMLVTAGGTSTDPSTLPVSYLKNVRPHAGSAKDVGAAGTVKGFSGHGNSGGGSGVPGIDSIANWTGSFTTPGFDSAGNPQSVWPFSMVGRPPERGGLTIINAPVIPVIVDLLRQDGSVRFSVDPASIVKPVLQSPMFQPFLYNSGFTQFNDAMQRASFANRISRGGGSWHGGDDGDNGWHTLLNPSVKTTRRMQIPFGSYVIFVNSDGSFAAVAVDGDVFVSKLFPQTVPVDNTTVIGAAELAGDMTTRDLTTLLFNNVYLYQGTINNCCVLGFHSYDLEPGDPSNGNRDRRYVMDYASWISPGLFLFGFEDITALSHELSETFNDPFIDNATPWWLSIDSFFGPSLCQNNLETGDVVEVLTSNPVFSIQTHGRTYHPQNEAMFPWFAFQSPSTALGGAYSFPDETTVLALSPANLPPGCGF